MRSRFGMVVGGIGLLVGCAMAGPELSDEDYAAAEASLLTTQAGLGHGREVMPYDPDGVPLLRSFRFGFRTTDHEIREMGVMPVAASNTLGVSFMDEGADDAYDYRVLHYDYLGPAWEGEARGSCGGGWCTVSLQRPPGAATWQFVLVGYHFVFLHGDHEIQELAILEDDGLLHVAFANASANAPFTYTVRYAYLPPSEISASDSRRASSFGPIRTTVRPGSPPAISGFHFQYWYGDNQLQSFAVELGGDGTVDFDFTDRDPEPDGGFWSWFSLEDPDRYTVDLRYAIIGRSWLIPTYATSRSR